MAKRDPLGNNIELVRIPFVGSPTNRDTSTKDQRYINTVFEVVKNPITGNNRTYIKKRSGLDSVNRPPAGNATGRGIYHWDETGSIYSVFANKIYKDTTDLGVTLDASTGRVWFTQTGPTSSVTRLVVSDGTKMYLVSSADAVTTVSSSSDPQFPTPNLGSVVFFNTYIYLFKEDGTIWNSDPDAPTSWASLSFKAAEMYGDKLEAVFRQKDQLVAQGKFSTEFFFDNANSPGSPIQRIDQNAVEIGTATKNSLAFNEGSAMWVSKAQSGGYSVWRLDELRQGQRVSNEQIEVILEAEGSSISSCTAFMFRAQGQMLYGLNLSSANRTLMYDMQENQWFEWADVSGNKFPCISATEKNGVVYLQHASNGRVYTLSPSQYQDDNAAGTGENFTVTIQTSPQDFGTGDLKYNPVLDIEGDITTGNLTVSWTDDDYANFSTGRTISMADDLKRLTRNGSFRSRAWKLTYADNSALRLEAMKLRIKKGGK